MTVTYLKLPRASQTVTGVGRHRWRRAETRDDDVSSCGSKKTKCKDTFLRNRINKSIFPLQGVLFVRWQLDRKTRSWTLEMESGMTCSIKSGSAGWRPPGLLVCLIGKTGLKCRTGPADSTSGLVRKRKEKKKNVLKKKKAGGHSAESEEAWL